MVGHALTQPSLRAREATLSPQTRISNSWIAGNMPRPHPGRPGLASRGKATLSRRERGQALFGGNHHRRRGRILILALVMLIVLTSMVLMLARSMRTEDLESANYVAELQADATARGAAEYVRSEMNGRQGKWIDDTQIYAQGVQIGPGYFWLLKHDLGNTTGAAVYAFGLTDESGKINLNYNGASNASNTQLHTSATTLSLLPNMTMDLANNVVAWRNAAGNSPTGGATSSYYLSLPTAYQAKNNNFESVEELLMVEGITPQILYGNDNNRNGIIDANDTDPNSVSSTKGPGLNSSPGGSNSTLGGSNPLSVAGPGLAQNVHGLADYVTVYGHGQVNLNTAPFEVLSCIAGMTQAQAQAIIAYRQSNGGFPQITMSASPWWRLN